MYTRSPQGRFPRDVRVPSNYAGNAFRPPLSSDDVENQPLKNAGSLTESPSAEDAGSNEISKKSIPEKDSSEHNENKPVGAFPFPKLDLGLSKIFSRGGLSLDGEELLILGLILLIASGGNGDDLILLLILLLFIH